MFNPRPGITTLPLHPGMAPVVVIDDVLADPAALVDLAARHIGAFAPAQGNAFPGLELPLPDAMLQAFADCLRLHAQFRLGVRRVVPVGGRLSLVTLQPDALSPLQRLCHRDRMFVGEQGVAVAGVLYLFDAPALGGTNFFRPLVPPAEIERLMASQAAGAEDAMPLPAGYLTRSNRWFEFVQAVPPRWNRLIFYDGGQFHGSHIEHPELLSVDPRQGRLTINLFFTARRAA